MNVSELVLALQHATGPDRKLDIEIAKLVGFKRRVEKIAVGPNQALTKKATWVNPKGIQQAVPAYTNLVDTAIELASFIAPDHVAGCSWEKGQGSARVNNSSFMHGANPAIALCAAALQLLLRRDAENVV